MVNIFRKTFQVSQCEDYVEDECKVEVKDVCNEYTDTKWVWFMEIQFHAKIKFICIFLRCEKVPRRQCKTTYKNDCQTKEKCEMVDHQKCKASPKKVCKNVKVSKYT